MRKFDTGKLKEVRKKLDSGQCRQDEIDEITKDLMEDCAEVGICARFDSQNQNLTMIIAFKRLHR